MSTLELPARINASPRPAVRTRREVPDLLIAGVLTALVLVLLAWNIDGFPTASDDEGTYLAQAWAVQEGRGLAHYTYWYDHPPLGWIQLAALAWLPAWLAPGLITVAAGRLVMLPVQAATLLLVYLVGRRSGLPKWGAALALLTLGLSPLFLTMGRQIYLDSFAVAWMLGAVALALSTRRHLWHYAAAGAATAIAILSKETILLVLPAVLLALWQNSARTSTRPWALGSYVTGLVLVGGFYPLYAVLRGELFPGADHVSLIGAWQFQLMSRDGSGSVFDASSGTNALVHSWLYYDRILLIGGLLAIVPALFARRLRPIGVAAAILTAVALRPGGYMPAMYVVQVLPFFALALAGVITTAVTRLEPRRDRRRAVAVAVVAVAALSFVVPRWYAGAERALTAADNAPYEQAAAYLSTRIPDPAGTTVVVDDVLWLDCVRAGYQPDRVIWFYKLDLDSEVAARLPGGWRDVDYLVSSPALRQDPSGLPTVGALLAHSTVVAEFGSSDGRIEIRKVDKENTP
ncbi:glycosyltransferase family 39 protein [Actinoplanes couchii]|uniref:Glycosyltransferase RgtA/B/C/D-like domain-containing protein n=1 Tax=Actinoplanes couchii TaxID=403638 RepID=A0ABQ3XBJ2_9ACTN|nr:glycosyltransferase family 39 protein [Actinoplanes couchii]MDR6323333.1 4-amino-4-deoxy-L-arabinose transferase-like glycosyltransferase [Actinoplanes couchii]GID55846.1 hypothetical protein Aco03nite_042500 [Actinoplanes couchii]